jgi:phosphatidylserine decarboxylase
MLQLLKRGNKMRLPFARYARRELIVLTIVLADGIVAFAFLYWPVAIVCALLLVFFLAFFRDPDRFPSVDKHVLVSPADGKIVETSEVEVAEFLGCPAIKVGIFMSIFDVHVNRSPEEGEVAYMAYHKGRFCNALRAKSAELNECQAVGLVVAGPDGRDVKLLVRQIAGVLARRIVCTCREGDRLKRGERIGMIKFGSRVELLVPKDAGFVPAVENGEKVKGGSSILFKGEKTE